jgi:AcrR family transcriptional regulator
VTAQAVAARAGLTKRYFYESFTDRDALLVELLGEFFTEVHSAMPTALNGASPDRRAWLVADTLVGQLLQDRQRPRPAAWLHCAGAHAAT